jgi:outer membrane protein assembly factor BamD
VTGVRDRFRFLVLLLLSVGVLAGCRRGFRPADFANPEALFRGAMQEYEAGNMGNAIAGFERLTLDLSSRDSLLTRTYYYLGMAHERRKEYLLAAQAYSRLTDAFPNDTLAPRALLGEARSYQSLWRKPELDADYGIQALGTFRVLLTAYPDGPEAVEARERIATLEDWLARKDYEVGVHYLRTRKAFDSAIIYFQDVIETYPTTPTARRAWLGLAQAYKSLRYDEELQETCDEMHRLYPGDAEVREMCGAPRAATDSLPPTATDTTGLSGALAAA